MTSYGKTCTLILTDFSEIVSTEALFNRPKLITIPLEDNWIFTILLQSETTLKLYPDSVENQIHFHYNQAIPLKILMEVRGYLLYRNVLIASPDDMPLNDLNDIVSNLNLNYPIQDELADIINNLNNVAIQVEDNLSNFENIECYHRWINRILLEGIRNIHNRRFNVP